MNTLVYAQKTYPLYNVCNKLVRRNSVKCNVYKPYKYIDYGTFVKSIENNDIEYVNLKNGSSEVTYYGKDDNAYKTNIILSETLLDDMVHHDVKINIEPNMMKNDSYFLLGPLLITLLFAFMARRNDPTNNLPLGNNNNLSFSSETKTGVKFDDVVGINEVKKEVTEIVDFLKNPDKFSKTGAQVPSGCLLYGNPGTGKTLIAKAIAGEAEVPFLSCSASQFIELFVGLGASRIRKLFENARKNAPCILFIDEIDAIGKKRGNNFGMSGGNDEREQTLNQLLTEMDGFGDNKGIIVIGATNRLDVLDEALLRPGRFDRKVYVPLPDVKGREKIINKYCESKVLDDSVNLKSLAQKSVGNSGAELKNIVNEAAILAARKNRIQLINSDFEEAFEKINIGLSRDVTVDEITKMKLSYHESGHCLVGYLQANYDVVEKVSIVPRGNTGGVTVFIPNENNYEGWYSRGYLESKIKVALAGHAAEELVYGKDEISSGAVSDFQQVSQIAYNMIKVYGFNDFGKLNLNSNEISDKMKYKIDEDVQKLVSKCYNDTMQILIKNRAKLDNLAQKLCYYENLNKQTIIDVIEQQ